MAITKSEQFNRNLEAQQNLVAGYDAVAQLATIEGLMEQQAPWATVLRSATLMSLTNNGIKPKNLEAFKRDFLQVRTCRRAEYDLAYRKSQVYGYHHLPLLIALQDLNLLIRSPPSRPLPFPSLRKPLRLVVDDVDDGNPNDISYVYSGYAPLSIRLVQCLTMKNAILTGAAETPEEGVGKKELPRAHPIAGWKGFEDILGSMDGATVDMRQRSGGEVKSAPPRESLIRVIVECGC